MTKEVRNADLEDEWAQRFLREVQAALDATEAAERAKTQAQGSA